MSRIASALNQQLGLSSLMRRQEDLTKAQERMVSGKRISRASDDPAGAARAERALADQTRSEGLLRTLGASRNAMSVAESSIGNAIDLVQTARETLVEAGNGAMNDSDRALLADRLKQLKGQLLSVAIPKTVPAITCSGARAMTMFRSPTRASVSSTRARRARRPAPCPRTSRCRSMARRSG